MMEQKVKRGEDMEHLLEKNDHMAGMERVEMVVQKICQPFPSVMRVTGLIPTAEPHHWAKSNIAVRIEVEPVQGKRAISRVYTIRQFDETTRLAEIDFVIHQDDSPAMRWLKHAKGGTSVYMVGPREHFVPDYDNGRKVALFADETAIPAVYSILRQWPEHAQGALFIECADLNAIHELPDVKGLERKIHIRENDEKAGKTGWLVNSAKSLANAEEWDVWVACEREEVREIRQFFMKERGLPKEQIKAIGYWRHGVSSTEIDRVRLEHYAKLCAKGDGLKEFDEFDLSI